MESILDIILGKLALDEGEKSKAVEIMGAEFRLEMAEEELEELGD